MTIFRYDIFLYIYIYIYIYDFEVANSIKLMILPEERKRVARRALRVIPAETRLTVYRRRPVEIGSRFGLSKNLSPSDVCTIFSELSYGIDD